MDSSVDWWEWVTAVAGTDVLTDIANKSGVTVSTVGNWRDGKSVDPHRAVGFARAYGQPPQIALVKCGLLEPDEVHTISIINRPVSELSDSQLVNEMGRLQREAARRLLEQSGDDDAHPPAVKRGGVVSMKRTVKRADRQLEIRPDAPPL